MRAIVIDAEKREIREENFDGDSLAYCQKIVGGYIERVPLRPDALLGPRPFSDDLFVNEEGLYKDFTYGFAIMSRYGRETFVGNGVIVGHDHQGETISAKAQLEDIKRWVEFKIDCV